MNENKNIKISKKIGLMIMAGIGMFATTKYVSVIESKSADGLLVNGTHEDEVLDMILDTMPIKTVTLRLDNVNPSIVYGGTWEIITGNASLSLGDGSLLSGLAYGNSTPTVPFQKQSYGMSHGHELRLKRDDNDGRVEKITS